MLSRIEALRPELRKSEQKVADLVLAQPNSVVNESIAVLAKTAGVSEPTVVRFCRAVGCKGFQNFKLRLAQDLATGVRYFHSDVLPGDPIADLTGKIFDGAVATLVQVRNHLSSDAIQKAVDILTNATRIEFYGQGASGVVAVDGQHKFYRLGVPTIAYSDPHIHCMSASILQSGSAVIVVSRTGRSLDILRSAELAKEAGAEVIALTRQGSPLAEICSLALYVDMNEDMGAYTPTQSRLAYRVILDVLAAGVALRRGTEFLRHLELAKRSLEEKRVPPQSTDGDSSPEADLSFNSTSNSTGANKTSKT